MGPIFLQTRIYEFIHPPLECFTKICVYIYVVYLWTKGINVQKKYPFTDVNVSVDIVRSPLPTMLWTGHQLKLWECFIMHTVLYLKIKNVRSLLSFFSVVIIVPSFWNFGPKTRKVSIENFGSIFFNFFRELNSYTHGVKCGKVSWAARIISKGSLSFAICASNSILFFRQASRFIHYDIWSMIMRLCGNKLLTRASILGFCQNFKLFSRAFFLGFSIMPS